MGIIISFVLNGEQKHFEYDESQSAIANKLWQTIVKDEKYSNIKGIKPDGTVIVPKKESEKCFAVQVLFAGSAKIYTYGSKFSLSAQEKAIVQTGDGLKVVTVVGCNKIEKTALPTLTNGKNPKWIAGKFIQF